MMLENKLQRTAGLSLLHFRSTFPDLFRAGPGLSCLPSLAGLDRPSRPVTNAAMNPSLVADFMARMHECLSVEATEGISRSMACVDHVNVMTGCSGSEAPFALLSMVAQFLAGEGGRFSARLLCSCEIEKGKQHFIQANMQHHPTACQAPIFRNLVDVAKGEAFNVRTQRVQFVEFGGKPVHIFQCGFSCKNLSRLHNTRSDYRRCAADGSGPFGSTFAATVDAFDR